MQAKFNAIAIRFPAGLALGGLAILGLAIAQPGQAQINEANDRPLDGLNRDNSDPLTGAQRGDGLGAFDLIHNAILGGGQTLEEFNASQQENLNSAAAEFRRKQQQRLQQQQGQPAGTVEFGEGVLEDPAN